ncbi:MAG: DUF5011 domain-containing protein [Fibrobacter sp.]|nr:DUF5011 domain-containing protein [Fibrobacter sp.]
MVKKILLCSLPVLVLQLFCALDGVSPTDHSAWKNLSPSILWKKGETSVSPQEVDSIRILVAVPKKNAYDTIKAVFPFSTHQGTVSVPNVSGLRVTVQGIDSQGNVIYSGFFLVQNDSPGDLEFTIEASQVSPPGPSDLETKIIGGILQVKWEDNSTNEDGFVILRGTNSSDLDSIAVVGADTKAFIDNTAQSSTTYYYSVIAFNGAGKSPAKSVSNVDVPGTTPQFSIDSTYLSGTIHIGQLYKKELNAAYFGDAKTEIKTSAPLSYSSDSISWTPVDSNTGVNQFWAIICDSTGTLDSIYWTVTVLDTVKPAITITGAETMYLSTDDTYVEPGAKAFDNVDGDISESIEITGEVISGTLGTYHVYYDVSDNSGNTADRKERTVIITDSLPPIQSPSITTHPLSQSVCSGSQAIFSIIATGTEPLFYHWRTGAKAPFNDIGTNSPTCTLTTENTTIISCVVSNQGAEEATSELCTLTVNLSASTPTGKATPDTVLLGDGKTVTLSVTVGDSGTGGSWVWYESDKATIVTTNPFTPTATKSYYVRSEGATCGDGKWSSAVTVVVNQPAGTPSGTATPASVCLGDGQQVTLEATGDHGSDGSWVWYESDTTTTVTTNPFTPTATKSYYVRSEGAASGNGKWSSAVTVTVNKPAGTPTGKATPDTVLLDDGKTVTLSVTAGDSGTGGSWVWYQSDKTTKVASNTFTPTATKSYYVRSEGATCGDGKWSSAVTVTVNQPAGTPSGTATPSSVCLGDNQQVTLDATGNPGTGGSWAWYESDKTTKVAANPLTPATAGILTYYVRSEGGASGNGKWSSAVTVTVNKPAGTPGGKAIPASVCYGDNQQVTLEATGERGSGGSWVWYESDKATTVALNPFTPTATKSYYVRSEGGTCGDGAWSSAVTVTVNKAAGTPSGKATPASVCNGDNQLVTLEATGERGSGGSWVWYESDKATTVASNPFTPTATKTYYVRSEGATCGDGAWGSAVTVTVNKAAGTPSGKATPASVCNGYNQQVTLEATGERGTGGSWVWYESDKATTVASNPFTPTATKTYYVRSEGATCGDGAWSSAVTVTVNKAPGTPSGTASPSSVCLGDGQQVFLNATGERGTNGSWVWYESNKSTQVAPSFTPTSPGTYTYYVRSENSVCGNGNWSGPVTLTVNTLSSKPTSIEADPGTELCPNSGNVTLTVKGGSLGSGANWKWYSDQYCTNYLGSGQVLMANDIQTYFVRAEGTCNTTATAQISLTLAPLTITPNTPYGEVCLNDNIYITPSCTADSIQWYYKVFGGYEPVTPDILEFYILDGGLGLRCNMESGSLIYCEVKDNAGRVVSSGEWTWGSGFCPY